MVGDIMLLAVGGVIGFAASIAQSVVTARLQKNQRREERIADQDDKVGDALAMVRTVLIDAHPDRVAMSATPQVSREILDAVEERWQSARLSLFAASDRHPDDTIRAFAPKLAVAVSNLVNADKWLLEDVLEHKGTEQRKHALSLQPASAGGSAGSSGRVFPSGSSASSKRTSAASLRFAVTR